MVPSSQPPEAVRRALRRLLSGDGAEYLLGDLEEGFHRRAASIGSEAAGRWYRRHALRAVVAWWLPHAWRARRRLHRLRGGGGGGGGARPRRRGIGWAVAGAAAVAVTVAWVATGAPRHAAEGAVAPGREASLVFVHAIDRYGRRYQQFTFPEVEALRVEATSLRQLAGYSVADRRLRADGVAPHRVRVARVSQGFFEVLDARAHLGRVITAEELRDGANVALLSYRSWTHRFGADASIVGSTVILRDVPVTVVGVLPDSSALPADADLWRPASAWLRRDTDREVSIVARMAAAVTLEEASAQVAGLVSRMRTAQLGPAGVRSAWVEPAPPAPPAAGVRRPVGIAARAGRCAIGRAL